jgi:hypothetical protein
MSDRPHYNETEWEGDIRVVHGLICDFCWRDFNLPAYWSETFSGIQTKFCSFECRENFDHRKPKPPYPEPKAPTASETR